MRKALFMGCLLIAAPMASLAANKEHEAIQRDIMLIGDELKRMQGTLTNEFVTLKTMMQQAINASDKSHSATLVLETRMTERLQALEKTVGSNVANISAKVDSMSDEFRAVKEELKDVNSRMTRMGTKMDDVLTAIKLLQSRPEPPQAPQQPTQQPGGPGGETANNITTTAPQAGVNTEKLFTEAQRDMMAGKYDVALKGFNDFIKAAPQNELACQAQYNIGDIHMRKNNVVDALVAFDVVLERYDKSCSVRPNAQYMKGRAFVKAEQPTAAKDEFRKLRDDYKGTEWERKANEALREIGFSATPPRSGTRTAAKKRR